MLYRKLGKTKEKVSILGFGSMRLPTINSNEKINEEKASEMITYGIDNGINIIDTAYSYHGSKLGNSGNSEIFLGKFLKEGYRDDILLVTKSPTWLMNKKEDFDYYLNEQLKKLQTDHIDIYLMHSLTENVWKDMKNLEVMEFMDNALASGKIKHIGFSSHTDLFSLAEIIDDYNKWEVGLT